MSSPQSSKAEPAPPCATCGKPQRPDCDGRGRVKLTKPTEKGYYLSIGCPHD
jgi:hypothetical protein